MATALPGFIQDLLEPGRYTHSPSEVRLVQTHISYVLIAPPYVYKIKKPVFFGFLDYRTPAKRRHFCHEEVRLNRRTSRGVYLGVVNISEVGGRYYVEDARNPVEAAVKMRYLPDEQMLFSMVKDGRVTEELMIRVARFIADFHRHAQTGPEISRYGTRHMVGHHALENFSQLIPFQGTTVTKERHETLLSWTEHELEARAALLDERVEAGRIRDGHGDLRPKHVYINGEDIRIIDCIEFNPAYRYQDVASDLAFLAMELDGQGRPDLSNIVLNEYLAQTGDHAMVSLWDFYRVYRAMVRGKVASLTFSEEEIGDAGRAAALEQAGKFFDLAIRYATPGRARSLTITCGLSGSGKSFRARSLACTSDAVIVRSDSVRKTLAGLQPGRPARAPHDSGIYTRAMTESTYATLGRLARQILEAGFPVILDATYSRRAHRAAARALADDLGVSFRILWCDAPPSKLRERLSARTDPREPSDAWAGLLDRQRQEFEPLSEFEKGLVVA